MTTYGFKYNGEGETTYYNAIEGVSLDILIEGKYYSKEKDGCYLYVGTSTEETSELTFNCVGGPYDDSICSIESQFVYHFVNGECNPKMQINSYCRRVTLNDVQIEPEINKYYGYHNPQQGSVDKCYLYLGKVVYDEQQVIDTLVLTSEHNNCGCSDLTLSYEFYDCLSGEKSKFNNVNLNSGIELIQNKFYKEFKDACYQFLGLKQEHGYGTLYIKEGPFEDCDCENKPSTEYMLFETCDGTLKFWKERNTFNDYEPDHYYSFGNMKYYYYCNPNDFPDFDFDNLTEEQFHIVINSDKVRLYANCFRFIGYTTEQTDSIYKEYPFHIFKSGECSDKAHNENNQYCEIFFECLISTCKGEEKHINLSNNIINLLRRNGYVTFKWNNKCYYIIEVIDEENPELQIMDIEHLNGIYPGCTECKNDGVTHKDNTEYYEKVNCEFADAVYNKAMSDRYGVEFCCEKDLQKLTIKKKLLDAGQLQDDIDLCEL